MLFGAHVSAAGGVSKAIDRVEEIGGDAVQVFTQSPHPWHVPWSTSMRFPFQRLRASRSWMRQGARAMITAGPPDSDRVKASASTRHCFMASKS